MATTKQLYGREGVVVINGIRFTPKMRYEAHCDKCGEQIPEAKFQAREVNYAKTKSGHEIYLCDKCFCRIYGSDERRLTIMRAETIAGGS